MVKTQSRRPTDVLDAGPPRDEWAERALLGSILLDSRIIGDVAVLLQPDDLYGAREQAIYLAMLKLHKRGAPPDATLVVGELDDAGHLCRTGDSDRVTIGYLLRLLDLLPSPTHWPHYLARVLDVSRRRRAFHRGIKLLGAVDRVGQREGERD